ncbi:LysR family transcriptional regulator [Arenibaculum sp.]|uniref:LysR family transcriptional regulator n=1 Tax=Arenibaculum sp. TaxID=2865862 RepID=UPI002E0D6695|nr:LysR family transcriptional regulator [Arenibaculum sp.]
MDIRYLRHFLAVAEELHFGRAASRLNMEQAPLSQSIRRLEAWLGVALFDRSARGGTRLTPAGATLVEEARKTVRQFEHAVAATRRTGGKAEEPVSVGFVTAGILRLLPAAIRSFQAQAPGARVQLVEASTSDLLAAIDADALDLALIHPIERCPAGVVQEELRRDRTIAALPRGHRLAERGALSMQDLAGEPMIFFPKSASPDLYERFAAFFRERGITPRIEQEARLTPTILSLVAAGLGYSLVQESARFLPFPDVVFRPVRDLPAELAWSLSLAWKPRRARAAASTFADSLRAAAAP